MVTSRPLPTPRCVHQERRVGPGHPYCPINNSISAGVRLSTGEVRPHSLDTKRPVDDRPHSFPRVFQSRAVWVSHTVHTPYRRYGVRGPPSFDFSRLGTRRGGRRWGKQFQTSVRKRWEGKVYGSTVTVFSDPRPRGHVVGVRSYHRDVHATCDSKTGGSYWCPTVCVSGTRRHTRDRTHPRRPYLSTTVVPERERGTDG